jgi:dsRNA-specific ribonuclease
MVERKNLYKISKQIGFDMYLCLNINVEKTPNILADIYEYLVGATYLEKGENILHEFLSLTLFNRPETKYLLKD